MADNRLHFPATERNREVVLEGLAQFLPGPARVLEIASGSGEHAVAITTARPDLDWWASDLDDDNLKSVESWRVHAGNPNMHEPRKLDVTDQDWLLNDIGPIDAIFSANMIHIAPWVATLGLFSGAGRYLDNGGTLILYGPYKRNGAHTAPSNDAFDQSLKSRNPDWGVRDLDLEVVPVAQKNGFDLNEIKPVPANNFILVFEKTA